MAAAAVTSTSGRNLADQKGKPDCCFAIKRKELSTRRAILSTTFPFGVLTRLYAVLVQITHPLWMSELLTQINIFPFNLRVDVTGIAAFALSAVVFSFC